MESLILLRKNTVCPTMLCCGSAKSGAILRGVGRPPFAPYTWYSAATLLHPALLSELRLAKLQKKNEKVKCYFYFLEQRRGGTASSL